MLGCSDTVSSVSVTAFPFCARLVQSPEVRLLTPASSEACLPELDLWLPFRREFAVTVFGHVLLSSNDSSDGSNTELWEPGASELKAWHPCPRSGGRQRRPARAAGGRPHGPAVPLSLCGTKAWCRMRGAGGGELLLQKGEAGQVLLSRTAGGSPVLRGFHSSPEALQLKRP